MTHVILTLCYRFASEMLQPLVGVHEFWNAFRRGDNRCLAMYIVWANGGSDPAIIAETDQTGSAFFNGDDGYALGLWTEDDYRLSILSEILKGIPAGWEVAGVRSHTRNHTLVRKHLTQGSGYDWASAAGTTAEDSQWIVYDQNTWDYLGAHVFTGTCGAAVPGCTNENATNYNSDANNGRRFMHF